MVRAKKHIAHNRQQSMESSVSLGTENVTVTPTHPTPRMSTKELYIVEQNTSQSLLASRNER